MKKHIFVSDEWKYYSSYRILKTKCGLTLSMTSSDIFYARQFKECKRCFASRGDNDK